jgi:predicted DNA-binding transcriptional regulator AlpA
MPKTVITFDEIEANLFKARMEELFRQAYEKGVEDGMKRYSYFPVLTNKHLAEILQIAMPTVIKVTSNPTFPRLANIKARYPRDAVFDWIKNNTEYRTFEKRTTLCNLFRCQVLQLSQRFLEYMLTNANFFPKRTR